LEDTTKKQSRTILVAFFAFFTFFFCFYYNSCYICG